MYHSIPLNTAKLDKDLLTLSIQQGYVSGNNYMKHINYFVTASPEWIYFW